MSEHVIGVSGHQNIPSEAMPFLKREISKVLGSHPADVVCASSLAAGADQMFADAVLRAGGKLHAIIPCERYEETFSEPKDLAHFKFLVDKAHRVEVLHYLEPSEEAFLNAGYQVVNVSSKLVAIWDGKKAKGKGGTADIVHYAQSKGKEIAILWPEGVIRK